MSGAIRESITHSNSTLLKNWQTDNYQVSLYTKKTDFARSFKAIIKDHEGTEFKIKETSNSFETIVGIPKGLYQKNEEEIRLFFEKTHITIIPFGQEYKAIIKQRGEGGIGEEMLVALVLAITFLTICYWNREKLFSAKPAEKEPENMAKRWTEFFTTISIDDLDISVIDRINAAIGTIEEKVDDITGGSNNSLKKSYKIASVWEKKRKVAIYDSRQKEIKEFIIRELFTGPKAPYVATSKLEVITSPHSHDNEKNFKIQISGSFALYDILVVARSFIRGIVSFSSPPQTSKYYTISSIDELMNKILEHGRQAQKENLIIEIFVDQQGAVKALDVVPPEFQAIINSAARAAGAKILIVSKIAFWNKELAFFTPKSQANNTSGQISAALS